MCATNTNHIITQLPHEINNIVRTYLKCDKCEYTTTNLSNVCLRCLQYSICMGELGLIQFIQMTHRGPRRGNSRFKLNPTRYVLMPPKNIFVRIQCAIYNTFFEKKEYLSHESVNKFRATQVRCHTEKYYFKSRYSICMGSTLLLLSTLFVYQHDTKVRLPLSIIIGFIVGPNIARWNKLIN
jgi:hypothetical protein